VNVTGFAISQTIQPPIKLPVTFASSAARPVCCSSNGELSAFVSMLSGLINRSTGTLPTAHIPVTDTAHTKEARSKEARSKETKPEQQSTAPARQAIASYPPVLFEAPQFTQIASQRNKPADEVDVFKQPIPSTYECKAAASRSMPSPGTIDPRLTTSDVAFGVRLTKNQPSIEDPGRTPSGPLATDLAPTPDGAYVAQAPPDPSAAGVASPSTRPHTEVAEVLAGESRTISPDPQPTIRPETARPRTTALEKAIAPPPPHTGTGGKGSGNAEPEQRDSAQASAPKPNQAAPARNDVHLQTNSAMVEVSARQFEMARAAEPPGSRTATSPSDLRKAASDLEINPALQPQPARQISLKLTGPDSTKVDLQLTERAGKMQIAVRTPDHALAKSMQTDLSELVGRLENRGFKAEAWIPTSGRHAEATAAPQQFSQGNSQNHPERQSGGSGSGAQQQRQGQNESNQRQQERWKTQLDETLSVEDKRMENIQ